MPTKINHDSQTRLSSKGRSAQDSEGDFKTPRTKFLASQHYQKFSTSSQPEFPPLEASPVQEVFVDDVDMSINAFLGSAHTRDQDAAAAVVSKRGYETPKTPEVDVSATFIDRYCPSPEEEEVVPFSEQESETFRFLKDDEVSSSSEKSFKLPSGLRNLFGEDGRNSSGRKSSKSRTQRGLTLDSELFSPMKLGNGLDEFETKSGGNRRGLLEPKALNASSDSSKHSVLRRPIGSRRKTVVDLSKPPLPEVTSSGSASRKIEESSIPPEEEVERLKTSPDSSKSTESSEEQVKVVSPLVTKGVIMRAQTHKTNVNGIRKAETGKIMSREELIGDRKTVYLRDSPTPKSLNPASFSEDDDGLTRKQSTLFQYSSSESDGGIPNTSVHKIDTDDGTFLGEKESLSYIYQEVQSSSSSKFSENGSSSGLVNRLGSSFKKAKNVVARKSLTDIPELDNTDMVIAGTIDEAVCKICYVCRKKLGCRVFVKNTGKKIKVEADDREKNYYLRASLCVTQLGGEEPACAINIRQSRADGMKTSFATLWDFYQRLEKGMRELEAGNSQ
ncbi:hypothetical protein FGB62_91g017 [Gracilaria domingensis]|nr:hypothetical protein FGB62_91g017 [Gracilaria domingensis]